MSSQKGKKAGGKSDSAIPFWVWIFGIVALAVIVGSFMQNRNVKPQKARGKQGTKDEPEPAPAALADKGSSPDRGVKRLSKEDEKVLAKALFEIMQKESKNPSLSHNLKNLELLSQVSDQVSQLAAEGKLTDTDTKEYSDVIDLLLGDLIGEDEVTRQIRDTASVVRAQLLSTGKGMSDAEVEAKYNVSTYSSPRFWEEHYKSGPDAKVDWYVEWSRLLSDGHRIKDLVTEFVKPDHRILVLGCGNSPMSLDMYRDGYHKQHNIDVSAAVIDQMRSRNAAEMKEATWETMDARQLAFSDGHFDAVIDKGTFDAVSTDAATSATILAEVERALRAGGTLISIGSKRLALLESSAVLSCGVMELRNEGRQASFMHRCRHS